MIIKACIDCSRAIECLHSHGFIHRDLKAENFFVGKKNVIKLGDFGEATKIRTKKQLADRRMTVLGTVAFMVNFLFVSLLIIIFLFPYPSH